MIRLDRLQLGFVEAFGPLAATVWTHQEQPKAISDLLSLSLVAGPTSHLQSHAFGEMLLPADSVLVTVTAAVVARRDIVRLNGFDYFHDVVGGDTITIVRDALLASIQVGETEFVAAAASGANAILLTAAFLGGLRSLTLLGDLTASGQTFSDEAVLERRATETCLVGVQAFSKSRTVRGGAASLAHAARSRLQRVSVSEALARFGIAVWDKGSINDLSAIAGGHWETRAGFDLTIGMPSIEIDPVYQLETVNMNFSVTP